MKPTRDEVKMAVITLLEAGHGIDMAADLSCYPDADDFYVVSYIGDAPPPGLDSDSTRQHREEGEISQYCETADEAAELYLKFIENRYEP